MEQTSGGVGVGEQAWGTEQLGVLFKQGGGVRVGNSQGKQQEG